MIVRIDFTANETQNKTELISIIRFKIIPILSSIFGRDRTTGYKWLDDDETNGEVDDSELDSIINTYDSKDVLPVLSKTGSKNKQNG